jgi:serine/threonine-protein kinase
MIGEAVGNYTITAPLGSGTMGVVFRAEHVRIARTAAIKVLNPELARNTEALQRFFTEARATSLIRHRGIVDVFDCGVDATGRPYIVMEHLVGETLADRLRRTPCLPWTAACGIARQVADAIAAAHDNGIVHRDLKPDNVFLVRDPADPESASAVKVLDFGIAKLLAADAAKLTMRGMVLGTPEYMAPEQCGGEEEVDARADIYALGCILFEMLTGEPPFIAESVPELFAAHMFRAAPSIGERVEGLPAWLADLVMGLLAKERGDRPASMRDVARALADGTKPDLPARRAVTPRWGAHTIAIAVAIVGVSALVAAVWDAGASSRRPAIAVPVSAPDPITPVVVAPVAPVAPIAPAAVVAPVAPAVRKRARAIERPRAGVAKSKHEEDTDGIVDL